MPKRKGKESIKQREYRLLMSRIKSAEKSGYRFTDDFKESLLHRSSKTLHNLRGIRLYREGFYLVTPEQAVTGAEGYYIRQKQVRIKSSETRKKHLTYPTQQISSPVFPSITGKTIDKLFEFIETFKPQYGFGRRAKQWNRMEAAREQAHRTIKGIYDRRVDTVGEDGITRSLLESGIDLDVAINNILQESDTEVIRSYGIQVANAMNGAVISSDEAKAISSSAPNEFDRISTPYEGQYRSIYEGKRHNKTAKLSK